MGGQEIVKTRQLGWRGPHDIEAGAAVHVNIDETGREDGVGKIVRNVNRSTVAFLGISRSSARGNGGDHPVLDKEERVLYLFLRRVETIGAEDDHISVKSCCLESGAFSVADQIVPTKGRASSGVWSAEPSGAERPVNYRQRCDVIIVGAFEK